MLKPGPNWRGDSYQMISGNLSRARGAFYLKWLQHSQTELENRLLAAADKKTGSGSRSGSVDVKSVLDKPISDDKLQEFTAISAASVKVPDVCTFCTDFKGARPLFEQSLKSFTAAASIYVFDGYVTEHIEIEQDISLLYKVLAFFEPDLSNKWYAYGGGRKEGRKEMLAAGRFGRCVSHWFVS